MFSSIRSRLWLSYALLLIAALLLTAMILLLYLLRSPIAYRQVYARLEAVQEVLLTTYPNLADIPAERLASSFQPTAETFKVRILILGRDLSLLADSRNTTNAPFKTIRRYQLDRTSITLRDENNAVWLVHATKLDNGNYLLICTPRPRLALLTLLRNDILPPFFVAGMAGMLLSLGIAYGLAQWIGNPLHELVTATRNLPGESSRRVPLHGPREIQELTRSFNAMSDRVRSSQASQREFVANVSHELKTPLTAIQGFAQSLQDGTANTEAARQQAINVIQQESGRMHRMVIDLLDLARMDAGIFDLHTGTVEIPALLQNTVEKFTHQAKAAGVTIELNCPDLPVITGDGDRLAQVFANLTDNAIKHTPAGGKITLSTGDSPTSGTIWLEFTDTGSGIPADALPHIFERFYQADPARAGGDQHGSGLGLAIVEQIITAHGGTINVRSIPGAGSTFIITLPLSMPQTLIKPAG